LGFSAGFSFCALTPLASASRAVFPEAVSCPAPLDKDDGGKAPYGYEDEEGVFFAEEDHDETARAATAMTTMCQT